MRNNISDFDRVWKAIETISGKHIVSLVDESNKYCFKYFNGKIGTIDMEFANGFAGLGYVKESKL